MLSIATRDATSPLLCPPTPSAKAKSQPRDCTWPGVAGATDDLAVLARLVAAAGGKSLGSDVGTLWATIAAEVPALGTMSYAGIPDTGLLIDGTPWAALAFAEGPSLHFQPAAGAPKEATRV